MLVGYIKLGLLSLEARASVSASAWWMLSGLAGYPDVAPEGHFTGRSNLIQ